MDSTTLKQGKKALPGKRPLKETLWNILGVLFYVFVAVGAIYHLIFDK